MKMYDTIKQHKYLWQIFTLLLIMGLNTHHALAVIPHEISIGCPGTPVPEAPSDLMRVKGDSETWTFVIKPEPGVTIDHQVWTYRSKDGSEPDWGTFTGGDGTNELTWASPNIADHFTINVKAKRHCAGTGEGPPDDFELTWGGDVVSVIIKRGDIDITEPQDNPQEVKVGQIVSLTAEVQNAPANANITYQWTVPGTAVHDWTHGLHSSDLWAFDDDQKASINPSFAWVDGANNRIITLSVTVNNKSIPSVTATFNVAKPSAFISVKKGGDVTLDTSTGAILQDTSNGEAGALIFIENVLQNEQANFGIQQIIDHNNMRKRFASNHNWVYWILTGKNYKLLDTHDFVPMVTPTFTRDSPNSGLIYSDFDEVIVEQNFTDCLMYKPPGAEGTESIWVPISSVSWSWAGHAIRVEDYWDPSDLVGHTNVADKEGSSTIDYPGHEPYTPGWTKNVKLDGYWEAENTH